MRSLRCLPGWILLFCWIAGTMAVAGTTGKIAGKIVDAQSHEALIGVNVLVVGTVSGGVSDVDGNYFIINLPPGKYQLKASAIGYRPETVTDVNVFVDQTTKIDFQLQPEAVQMGEVQVTATRPIVQKDLTSTTSTVTSEQIATLPVEDVATVINLQAGVVDGHFRGGRSDEVKYLVDGMPVNDVFSGSSALEPEVNTIQEVQVLSGTFNAEYGEALSGVVNQVTKIGGDKYAATLSTYGGAYLTGRTDLFQHTNFLSPIARAKNGESTFPVENLEGTLSGPVVQGSDFMKFFIAGRYLYDDSYIYGQRVFNPSDSSYYSKADPNKWVVVSTGDGKFVPMNYNKRTSLQAKLSFNLGNAHTLTVQGLYQNQDYKVYDHQFELNPDGAYSYFQKSFLTSVSYNQVFNASAFLDVNASVFQSDFEQYAFPDTITDNGYSTVIHANSQYQDPALLQLLGPNTFLTGGTDNWHFSHITDTYTGKIDLTDQLTHIDQIKTGVEIQYHRLHDLDYQIHRDATTGFIPMAPPDTAFDYNLFTNHPYQLAAYIQDKIELDYLIVNAGLRWDYFQPDGQTLINPDNIAVLDTLSPPYPTKYFRKATAKQQLSPRFGLSYPISDGGAVHISYGHFFQIPEFQYLYKNPNFRVTDQGSQPDFVGNTIGNADLQPQSTTMYEIGLQQQLAPSIGVTVTGFAKDIRNLLGIQVHKKFGIIVFGQYVNKDYGQVKGITLSFERRITNGFGANLDYTYQIAQGDASDPNEDYLKASAVPAVPINSVLVPLNWDRRHSINLTLTESQANNFTASFIGRLSSGLPYTPTLETTPTGTENSDVRPTIFDADVNVTKYVTIMDKVFSFFLKVYNLFDTANEINIYTDSGRAGYSVQLNQAVPPQAVNTLAQYIARPDFYSPPREILLGGSVNF